MLNEQDCLNRMLRTSTLRWAALPPSLFPNGYVYFRRPLPSVAEPEKGPVLVHCNWINGIPPKRFLLREMRMWHEPLPPRSAHAVGGTAVNQAGAVQVADSAADANALRFGASARFVVYTVGATPMERSLGGQVLALRTALALAHVTNRTLVLPPFYALPFGGTAKDGRARTAPAWGGSTASAAAALSPGGAPLPANATSTEGRRLYTYFFEYAPLLRHFPRHCESSLADWLAAEPTPGQQQGEQGQQQRGQQGQQGQLGGAWSSSPTYDLSQLLRSSRLAAAETPLDDDATDLAGGGGELVAWLRSPHATEVRALRVRGLLGTPPSALVMDTTGLTSLETRLDVALQPAPEVEPRPDHIISP